MDVLCGVKQGCALSSILFIIAIDPILKAIQRGREDIHNLSYADDEVVIENCKEDLENSISILVETAGKIGLSVNPRKCHSLHIRSDHKSCLPTVFHINGTPVSTLFNYDITSYLGKPFGFQIAPDTSNLEDYILTGKTILQSVLTDWQKIDAIKTFLFPSFHYAMRINRFSKTDWSKLDAALRPLIKKTLKIPKKASN